jgi:ubiquinone/menaquinone biosynthesis C-methylase UbiE
MRQPSSLSRLLSWGLSVFFGALYHPMAWTYDWVAATVSIGRWKNWVLSILPDLPGPRVLELGHGPGHLQISLARGQIIAFGLDQSRQMGRLARRNMSALGLKSRLVNGMAQSLPYGDQAFNQVVATFPTPYIFERQTIEEIYRVLRPGGALIVVPTAWITGSSPGDRVAASAFRILGQAPEWEDRELQPLQEAGFFTTVDRRKLASSEVLVIKAVKQTDERSPAI